MAHKGTTDTLLNRWNGTYDGLPDEAKMLISVGYETGYDMGFAAARRICGCSPFTPRDAEIFAALIRQRRLSLGLSSPPDAPDAPDHREEK